MLYVIQNIVPRTETIESFIKSSIRSGEIYNYKLASLSVTFRGMVKIYKSKSSNVNKLSKDILNIKNCSHIKTKQSLLVVSDNKIYIFIFDWIGLKESIESLKSVFNNKNKIIKKLNLMSFEVDRSLSKFNVDFKQLINKNPGVILKNEGIELRNRITPDKILYKKKVSKIPLKQRITINNVTINTDPHGFITAIKLDHIHPNADKNLWYCLGSLKLQPLNNEIITLLKGQIETYKLDDCYWLPEWFKK